MRSNAKKRPKRDQKYTEYLGAITEIQEYDILYHTRA